MLCVLAENAELCQIKAKQLKKINLCSAISTLWVIGNETRNLLYSKIGIVFVDHLVCLVN